MQNNLDVIRGMYSAFARGDVASVLAALMPEIVWIEAEGFPSAGTYTTPDAVLHNVFMRLATEWDAFSAAPHEYVCDRQSVVAIATTREPTRQPARRSRRPSLMSGSCGGLAWSDVSSSRIPRSFSGPCGECFAGRMMMSQSSKPERDPAEVYDELFVPALFAQWGPRVAEAAAIELGQRVLDVGCGTGVLACAAARAGGPGGSRRGARPQ